MEFAGLAGYLRSDARIRNRRCCSMSTTSQPDKAHPPPIGEGFNTPRTGETTNTWLTPLRLIKSLGAFDLDPHP